MITDFFNSTAVIKKANKTSTAMGSIGRTYTTRIASLPCRINAKKANEQDEFGKWTMISNYRLYCEATTVNKAIEESDRVILGTRTFQVKAINNPGLLDRHLQIDLLEIV